MASFTDIGRWRMVARFTLCDTAIMTTDTSAHHFIVIQRCYERQPTVWRYAVAGITIVRSIRMISGLTLRNHIIVTTDTTTNHFVVIQRCNKW